MSIVSMTGFARAHGTDGVVSWTWEARSVNGKSLDIRLRLPQGYDALDLPAREMVGRFCKRGNVSVGLTVARVSDAPVVRINEELLGQLMALAPKFPQLGAPTLDGMLAVKGVIETVEVEEAEEVRAARDQAMLKGLDEALTALAAMRGEEGKRMAAVLDGHLVEINRLTDACEATAALRPENIRARLHANVQNLVEGNPSFAEERLMQEALMMAAKADVREELDRLRAHIAAGRDMLAKGGAVGRKLDFLCQEFNREANTTCSKSQDVELTRIGLDLKAVIEQFREQVQNIE